MITVKFLTGWNAHLTSKSLNIEFTNMQMKPALFQSVLTKVLNFFDARDYFYGLFQAMTYSGVSPFIATHDYCIKILHIDHYGTVEMNISPIYHLGLEYPEDYKTKHGKALDQDAVIGLLEKPTAGTMAPGHTSYSYGVDAGILFKDSDISHNKQLTLKVDEIRDGMLVTLRCENQTSSTTISWNDVGVINSPNQEPREIKSSDWAAG